MPIMLDLCCGYKGASLAFRKKGWRVVSVDIEKKFDPDFVCDVRSFAWDGYVDFVWASPPCNEFSRESMPWCKTGVVPDMSIVEACVNLIDKVKPKYWVIENVRGAVRWFAPLLGPPRFICGPFFFWGFFPKPVVSMKGYRNKQSFGSGQAAERAIIPPGVSVGFYNAIVSQSVLL